MIRLFKKKSLLKRVHRQVCFFEYPSPNYQNYTHLERLPENSGDVKQMQHNKWTDIKDGSKQKLQTEVVPQNDCVGHGKVITMNALLLYKLNTKKQHMMHFS